MAESSHRRQAFEDDDGAPAAQPPRAADPFVIAPFSDDFDIDAAFKSEAELAREATEGDAQVIQPAVHVIQPAVHVIQPAVQPEVVAAAEPGRGARSGRDRPAALRVTRAAFRQQSAAAVDRAVERRADRRRTDRTAGGDRRRSSRETGGPPARRAASAFDRARGAEVDRRAGVVRRAAVPVGRRAVDCVEAVREDGKRRSDSRGIQSSTRGEVRAACAAAAPSRSADLCGSDRRVTALAASATAANTAGGARAEAGKVGARAGRS